LGPLPLCFRCESQFPAREFPLKTTSAAYTKCCSSETSRRQRRKHSSIPRHQKLGDGDAFPNDGENEGESGKKRNEMALEKGESALGERFRSKEFSDRAESENEIDLCGLS